MKYVNKSPFKSLFNEVNKIKEIDISNINGLKSLIKLEIKRDLKEKKIRN